MSILFMPVLERSHFVTVMILQKNTLTKKILVCAVDHCLCAGTCVYTAQASEHNVFDQLVMFSRDHPVFPDDPSAMQEAV